MPPHHFTISVPLLLTHLRTHPFGSSQNTLFDKTQKTQNPITKKKKKKKNLQIGESHWLHPLNGTGGWGGLALAQTNSLSRLNGA